MVVQKSCRDRIMKLLVGIAVFLAMIALAYIRLTPESDAPAPAVLGPQETVRQLYYPQLTEAHWGMNCNGMPTVNLLGVPDHRHPYQVQKNNALAALNDACRDNPLCTVAMTPKRLGFDPAPNCKKELELRYRCF